MRRLLLILVLLLSGSVSLRAQFYEEYKNPETYFQYLPAVCDFGLGLVTVPTQTTLVERMIKLATSYVSCAILTQVPKHLIKEERPDGWDFKSFPSGHTATAFTGAELIRQDYGWGWGMGAYAVATGVGVMRCIHQRHWWWDVLAGAGVGILSGNIGRWTLEPIENLFNYHPHAGQPQANLAISTYPDPYSGTLMAGFRLTF